MSIKSPPDYQKKENQDCDSKRGDDCFKFASYYRNETLQLRSSLSLMRMKLMIKPCNIVDITYLPNELGPIIKSDK